MIKNIFLKEAHENLITTKAMVSFIIIILLFIVNGFIFNLNYDKNFKKYSSVRNINIENIRNNTESFVNLVFTDQQLIKPPSNIFFISEAEETVLPNGIQINFFSETNPQYYKSKNIFFSAFSSIDWTYILIFFISFVCISLSYGSFSGEKVNGTLKLILANFIPRWKLILGKYLGILSITFIPVLIGMIISLIIIQLNPRIAFSVNDILLIFIYFIGVVLFISLNIFIGLIISCMTSRPVVSLSIVLILWIIFAIVIPNVSWLLSKQVKSVSSISVLNETANRIINEAYDTEKHSMSWNSSWAGNPPNETVLKRNTWVNEKTRLSNDVWREYRNDIINQTKTAINLSKISPFSLFRFFGETISDNGFSGYSNFYNQAMNYKTTFRDFLIGKDQADNDSHHLIWSEQWCARSFMSNKPVEFSEIPQFAYTRPSLTQTMEDCKFDILLLVLWNLLLFSGTYAAFIKYDVR
ncbi:ABC transporter permease [candidate division KSB1 bacterium]